MYVKTNTYLDKILAHKVEEVAASKAETPEKSMVNLAKVACPVRNVIKSLDRETVSLIAEVKKASPSKGVLIEDFDPVTIGKAYGDNGAAAISVLTDENFFQGKLDYLTQVHDVVRVPVLRKDFVIDAYQIYEARSAYADLILLIVAALDDAQLKDFYTLTSDLGMTALVEVHTETEMDRALTLGAQLVGVNNRDLRTFDVDLMTTAKLAKMVPEGVLLVAESGIRTGEDVHQMGTFGASAVLVGEHLVKSGDIAAKVREMSSQLREVIA